MVKASPGRRSAAFLIDFTVFLVLCFLYALPMFSLFVGETEIGDDEFFTALLQSVGLYMIGYFGTLLVAAPLMEISRLQGTPGKFILGLKIVGPGGQKLGAG